MTAPAPSPAEAAVIDRFGIFDEERIVEEVARAMFLNEAEAGGYLDTAAPAWEVTDVGQAKYRRLAVAGVTAYRAQDGGAEEATWPLVAALDQAIDRYEALREAVLEEADLMDARLAATGVLLDRCIRPGDRLRAAVADVAGTP